MAIIRALTFILFATALTHVLGGTIWLGLAIGSGVVFFATYPFGGEPSDDHAD
jgi:hypothetical protein